MRELLARVGGQRRTVAGTPENDTAAGRQRLANGVDQHSQITQSLVDGQVLQIVEAGRRRRDVLAEVAVIGREEGGMLFAGNVVHQTALQPFGGVEAAVTDVNEDRTVVAEELGVLRVRLRNDCGNLAIGSKSRDFRAQC